MRSNSIVFLIEPTYHGLQYVELLKKSNTKYVIITRHKGPYEINDEEVIYDDSLDPETIVKKINEYLNGKEFLHKGILPGNDFCVPIAFAVANKLGFKSNPEVAGIYSRNKELMRSQLRLHNINQPKSKSFQSLEELKKENFIFPVVVKPSDMTGIANVQLVYKAKELEDAALRILNMKENILGYSHNNIVLVEEFVKGPEFSTELFLEEGKLVFANVTEKQKGELPYFVETGHVVTSSITNEEENRVLIEAGYKAARAIQIVNGPVHAEMVLCEGKAKIIEITARIGGDNIMKLVDLATGVYLPELAIKQCLGEKIEAVKKKNGGATIKFITSRPGVLSKFDLEEMKEDPNIVDYSLDLFKGKCINSLKSSDDRLGYIIAIGSNGYEAKINAEKAAKKIRIEVE